MREAGLEVSRDRGRQSRRARWPAASPQLPEVWSGSHLDTPPDGGRFDGALGVLSALDAAEAIARRRWHRAAALAVIAFRLEEGPRFGRGVFGSRAICGLLDDDEGDLLDPDGISLAEAFAALGLGELPRDGLARSAALVLRRGCTSSRARRSRAAGAPLGIVSSIAGMAGLELAFSGRRGHAGTVPMPLRSDALGAAARFVVDAHDVARALPGAVATIGRLTVAPGRDATRSPNAASCSPTCARPTTRALEALVEGAVGGGARGGAGRRLRGRDRSRAGATRRSR